MNRRCFSIVCVKYTQNAFPAFLFINSICLHRVVFICRSRVIFSFHWLGPSSPLSFESLYNVGLVYMIVDPFFVCVCVICVAYGICWCLMLRWNKLFKYGKRNKIFWCLLKFIPHTQHSEWNFQFVRAAIFILQNKNKKT